MLILCIQRREARLGALSEYPCYNVALGLCTSPEGVTQDVTEMKRHSPPDYVENVFQMAGYLQSLHLTENERNILKCISLFSPGMYGADPGFREGGQKPQLGSQASNLFNLGGEKCKKWEHLGHSFPARLANDSNVSFRKCEAPELVCSSSLLKISWDSPCYHVSHNITPIFRFIH